MRKIKIKQIDFGGTSEDYVKGDGTLGRLNASKPDWNENRPAASSHILNRTHYIEENPITHEFLEVRSELLDDFLAVIPVSVEQEPTWTGNQQINEMLESIVHLSINDLNVELGDLRAYNDVWYYGNLYIANVVDSNVPVEFNTGEDFVFVATLDYLIFIGSSSVYGTEFVNGSFITNEEIIHKLDNKFLNDIPVSKIHDIAPVAKTNSYNDLDNLPTIPSYDFAQADWNESNEDSAAYIKNKPTIPDTSSKADKVTGAINNNFAALDSNGNLKDSGKNASSFLTSQDLSNYYTKSQIDGLVASVYKPQGSISSISNLGSLSASHYGYVYNISNSFTTTSDFVEGANVTYPAGTNVVIINVGTEQSPTYKYDVLSGVVDLSGYAKTADLAPVATSGSYNDLNDKPTIPAISGTSSGNNWTEITINGVSKNIPSVGSGLTNYDFIELTPPTITNGETTITFAANQRNTVELTTNADLSIVLVSNNKADNYIWITNSHSTDDIDVTFDDISFGNTSINNIIGTDSFPTIPAGKTIEIGVHVTSTKARITSIIL